MSSVVVVGGVAGATGALAIFGVIVGGVIAGVAITNYVNNKIDEADEKKVQESFENNKEYLKNQFETAKINLSEEIDIIDEEFKNELIFEINKIDKVSEKLLKKYTLNEFRSVEHERFINSSILQFNEEIYKIRQKIELKRLDILENKAFLSNKITQIIKQFNELPKDLPDSFKNDFEDLKEKFNEIKAISLLKEQSESLIKFEKSFNRLLKEYNLAQNINISNIEEQKLSLSPIDENIIKIKEEIYTFSNKIKNLDEEVFSELNILIEETNESKYEQRLAIIMDQIKLKYGKLKEQIAETNVYKYNLVKLMGVISNFRGSEELLNQITSLLLNKYIDKNNFDELSRRLNEFVAHSQNTELIKAKKSEFIGKVKNTLEGLGYGVIDDTQEKQDIIPKLEKGEIVYLDTEWKEYKIMLKIDEKSQIATRMVKFVSSEDEKTNVSTYQRQKDAEITKKWCKDYDRFLENMKDQGVNLDIKVRKEVEEEPVMYIVDKTVKLENIQKTEKKNLDGEMRV